MPPSFDVCLYFSYYYSIVLEIIFKVIGHYCYESVSVNGRAGCTECKDGYP